MKTPTKGPIRLRPLLESSDLRFFSLGRLILMALLVVAAIFFFVTLPKTRGKPVTIFKNVYSLTKVSFTQKGGTWGLTRVDGAWKVTDVRGAVMNSREDAIEEFLDFLKLLSGHETSKPERRTPYGTLTTATATGSTAVAVYTGPRGELYLSSRGRWFLLTGVLPQRFFPSADHLMETVLLRFTSAALERIEAGVVTVNGIKHYGLHKTHKRWYLGQKARHLVNGARLEGLLRLVTSVTFRRIIETPCTREKKPLWRFYTSKTDGPALYRLKGKNHCPPGEKGLMRVMNGTELPVCVAGAVGRRVLFSLPQLLQEKLVAAPAKGSWEQLALTGGTKLKAVKDDARWVVFGSSRFDGDKRVIESTIAALMNTPVSKPVRLKGELPVALELRLTNNWDNWRLRFYKTDDEVAWFRREEEPWFFKVTPALRRLLPESELHFKDRRVLPSGEITGIIRTGLGITEQVTIDSEGVARHVKPLNLPVSTPALNRFHETVKELRANSFVRTRITRSATATPSGAASMGLSPKTTVPPVPPKPPAVSPPAKPDAGAKEVPYRPFTGRTVEILLKMSSGITARLLVDARLPMGRVGTLSFTLTKRDHLVLITPWVRAHPFEWSPTKVEAFVFTNGKTGWRVRKEGGYWLMEEKGKRTILTPTSVVRFLEQVRDTFKKLRIVGYGKIPTGEGGYMNLTFPGGLPQTISVSPRGDRLWIWNRRWPVLWTMPLSRADFLYKQGAAGLKGSLPAQQTPPAGAKGAPRIR